MKCPNCGREIANDSNYCEYCGKKVKTSSKAPLRIIIVLTVIILAVVILVSLLRQGSAPKAGTTLSYTERLVSEDRYDTITSYFVFNENNEVIWLMGTPQKNMFPLGFGKYKPSTGEVTFSASDTLHQGISIYYGVEDAIVFNFDLTKKTARLKTDDKWLKPLYNNGNVFSLIEENYTLQPSKELVGSNWRGRYGNYSIAFAFKSWNEVAVEEDGEEVLRAYVCFDNMVSIKAGDNLEYENFIGKYLGNNDMTLCRDGIDAVSHSDECVTLRRITDESDTEAFQACRTVDDYRNYLSVFGKTAIHFKEAQYFIDQFKDITFTVKGVSFTMKPVEGGTFWMGAQNENPNGQNYDIEAGDNEEPVHNVTLSSYYIGETEVTQALWEAVMGRKPTYAGRYLWWDETHGLGGNYPAYGVSWDDCQQFINRLKQITGVFFRLPTEAEWEYAARGGKKSNGYKYSGSNDIGNVAWYENNTTWRGDKSVHRIVKKKSPNELGIYDMSGNVSELCNDRYGLYSDSTSNNPQGPSIGDERVLRNGDVFSFAKRCRVTNRQGFSADGKSLGIGFRLALSPGDLNQVDLCVRLSDYNIDSFIASSNKVPAIIDFYGEWCPPCKTMDTILNELIKKYASKIVFGRFEMEYYNKSKSPRKYNIEGVPTLLFVKNGEIVARHVGVDENDKEEIEAEIERYFFDVDDNQIEIAQVEDLRYTLKDVTFTMKLVDGGTFIMGSNNSEWDDEKPAHEVTVNTFYMGETEVTKALWKAVMGSRVPSHINREYFNHSDNNLPIEVDWNECQDFIHKLNQLTGDVFRLPTEAEWEYAAKGGKKSRGYKYAGSNNMDDVAWFFIGGEHAVKQKRPNELGLYDMSGNLLEYCSDLYGPYSNSSQTNPRGPLRGEDHVLRGGTGVMESGPEDCQVTNRCAGSPGGIRLCLQKSF